MIQINLPSLSKENIYATVLQTVEDICDDYNLNREFGPISTANQEIVDYILELDQPVTVDVDIYIENTDIAFSYTCSEAVFAHLKDKYTEVNILEDLTDSFEITSDNKAVSVTFHVKTYQTIVRNITQKETIRVEEDIIGDNTIDNQTF